MKKYAWLLIIISVVFFSCDFFDEQYPPFVISGFEIKKGEIEDVCRTASAMFYFKNTANIEIAGITMSFHVYYSDGTYPGYGSNRVDVEYKGVIPAGNEELIIVSLDNIIQIYKELSFVADQIFVEKITYKNGSTWVDHMGFWQMQGGT
jgi:hypothetical protein